MLSRDMSLADYVVSFVAVEVSFTRDANLISLLITPNRRLGPRKRDLKAQLWDELLSGLPRDHTLQHSRYSWTNFAEPLSALRSQLVEQGLPPRLVNWHEYLRARAMWRVLTDEIVKDGYEVLWVAPRGTVEFTRRIEELQEEFRVCAYRWCDMRPQDVWGLCVVRRMQLERIEGLYRDPLETPETSDAYFIVAADDAPVLVALPLSHSRLTAEEAAAYAAGERAVNAAANNLSYEEGGEYAPTIDLPDWAEPQLVSLLSYPLPEYLVSWSTEKVLRRMKDDKIVTMRIDAENPTLELPVVVAVLQKAGHTPYRDDDLPLNAVKVDVRKSERKALKLEIRRVLQRQLRMLAKMHRRLADKEDLEIDVPEVP